MARDAYQFCKQRVPAVTVGGQEHPIQVILKREACEWFGKRQPSGKLSHVRDVFSVSNVIYKQEVNKLYQKLPKATKNHQNTMLYKHLNCFTFSPSLCWKSPEFQIENNVIL